MERATFRMPSAPAKKNNRIHSEKHELIAQMRRDFGETATKGKGSFGFYLHLLKPVPCSMIRIWLGDIAESTKLTSQESRRRVFWWMYAQQYGKKKDVSTTQP